MAHFFLMRDLLQDCHVECVLQVAEVLSYHLLRQALSTDEKPGDSLRTVLEESTSDEVINPTLGLLIEQIQPHAVLPFSYCFGHLVARLGYRLGVIDQRQLVAGTRVRVAQFLHAVHQVPSLICVAAVLVLRRTRL